MTNRQRRPMACGGSGDRQRPHHFDRSRCGESRRGVLAVVTAENAGKLGKGDYNYGKVARRPRIRALSPGHRGRHRRNLRAGAAPPPQLIRVDYSLRRRRFDLELALTIAPRNDPQADDINGGPLEHRDRRFRARVRFGAGATRRDLHYARSVARDDGAACLDGGMGWRPADGVDVQPDDRLGHRRSRRRRSACRRRMFGSISPYHRRRLRRQAVPARRRRARGAGARRRWDARSRWRCRGRSSSTTPPIGPRRSSASASAPTPDGKITAIAHESWSGNLKDGKPETAVDQTRLLYAGANRMTAMRLAVLDLPEGNAMRAPGEAPGMMALEIAMDEMAEKLGLDPVEFRMLNDTQVDPEHPERPVSQRISSDACASGAERFGWDTRNPSPAQRRDGRWLVGMGVAAAFRNNMLTKSAARVRLGRDGIVTVETDMTDIGTGSYTIIAQTAAEMMGVSLEQVVVRLGDSAFPSPAGSGGQFGANNSTSGVYAACVKLREAVAAEARLQLRRRRVRGRAGARRQSLRHRWSRRRRTANSSARISSSMATSPRPTSNRPSAHISSRLGVDAATARNPRAAHAGGLRARAASSIRKPRAAR